VLVGGLGSSSSHAAIDQLDTKALGYAAGDVVRFSYRGGTTAEHPYDAADTQVDIRRSGQRLRALLERLQAENPGVPIDVVAHSQGGLVARSALGESPPATAWARTSRSPAGAAVAEVARRVGFSGIEPGSVSVAQLAETSGFIRELNARPLPAGVRVTSVAARADAVVAAPRSRLRGAANVVVDVGGLNDHSALPGSAAARREVALAIAGRGPTCEALGDALVDEVVGHGIGQAEDAVGVGVTLASG
jgi:pimeloyl-ACP methyl ester carboxylesterase